jgi:hypothetical protein
MQPFVWREVGGRDRLAAVVAAGRIARFASDAESPSMVWDAIPAWRSAGLVNPAFMFGPLILILTAASWPVLALTRRTYGIAFPLQGDRAMAYRLIRIASMTALAAIAGWIWVFSLVTKPMGLFFLDKQAMAIHLIELLTLAGFVGGLAASLFNLAVVLRAGTGWRAKAWAAAMVLAMAALVWTGWVGHLLGFSAHY